MSLPLEDTLRFAPRFVGPLVRVEDYDCRVCRSGPMPEEQHQGESAVVLLRRGVFTRHFGRRSVTADVNQAVFFRKGATYRVSHPGGCGDRGTVFMPSEGTLADIARTLDPGLGETTSPFVFDVGPYPKTVFARHRALVHTLEHGSIDALAVEEEALAIFADVLRASYTQLDRPKSARKQGTNEDRAELVEATKALLASHLGEHMGLSDIARLVYASPFHLSRVFQRHTGISLHRYRTMLRVRTAFERIESGAENLAALANELGFTSHSHLTDTFRKELGLAPSAARTRRLRELSKNLEARARGDRHLLS